MRPGTRGGRSSRRAARRPSEAAGSGAGPPGPLQGRSGSSWAPRPSRWPGERRKGAGGTRPRPATVMVSAEARLGRGGRGAPLEEEAGSQEPLADGRAEWGGPPGVPGLEWADGPSWRRGRSGAWAPRRFSGGEGPTESRGGLRGFVARPWVIWNQGRNASVSSPELGFQRGFHQG